MKDVGFLVWCSACNNRVGADQAQLSLLGDVPHVVVAEFAAWSHRSLVQEDTPLFLWLASIIFSVGWLFSSRKYQNPYEVKLQHIFLIYQTQVTEF